MRFLKLMTKRQLASIIINDQIKRGLIKSDNKKIHIKVKAKFLTRAELYKLAKLYI